MADVQEIDAATAKAWADAGDAVLMDVREAEELAQARIGGAHHNPMSAFDPENLPHGDGKKLIVFCAHGMRSYQVAAFLLQKGIVDNAYSMSGGIVAWAQSGLPIE